MFQSFLQKAPLNNQEELYLREISIVFWGLYDLLEVFL